MKNKYIIIFFLFLFFSNCATDDLGDPRDSLLGTWTCQEESQLFGEQSYDVEISKSDTAEFQIFMYNFFDRKMDVLAELDGSSLSIPAQIVDNWEIKGSGEISEDSKVITWHFTANDGGDDEDFTAYFTQKSSTTASILALNLAEN